MLYGRVRRVWNNEKYAFVKRNDGQNDTFLHASDIENGKLPPEGTLVEFDLGLYRDKPVARNARVINVEVAGA